jgi:hypothetical protein
MSDEGTHRENFPAPTEIMPSLRYTFAPRITTPIVMKTLPGASCIIHRLGEPNPGRSLKLFADYEGMVRFHVRPSAESEGIAKVVLDCEVSGKVTRFPLELRASAKPTEEIPAPSLAIQSQAGASVRPGLSEQDMLHLSNQELHKRGYPARPNPEQAPGLFNTWRRIVSTPMTIIEPHTVSNPGISHGPVKIVAGPQTANNWSGFELRGVGPYAEVVGRWVVPNVHLGEAIPTYSAFWIGIDGDGLNDLVQAGTEQNNVTFDFDFLGTQVQFSICHYYAWTQFLPQQPFEQQITNFSVKEYDEIFTAVWIQDTDGTLNPAGSVASFMVTNLTNSQSTTVQTPVGNTSVSCSEAEWIMERPTVNSSLPDLADYGLAVMREAWATPDEATWYTYQGDTNVQYTMVNGSDLLSSVVPINDTTMLFAWARFN